MQIDINEIKEEFLSFLWQYRKVPSFLKSINGEEIEILHPGERNTDEGADFVNARIKINNTLWIGNVEIHVKSSDWEKHQHPLDSKYESTILHVVYEANKKIYRETGEELVTVELKNCINYEYFERYSELLKSTTWIPCHKYLLKIENKIIFNNWLSRLLVERLENKSLEIKKILDKNLMDWQSTFYQWFCMYFGFKLNNLGFFLLANSLPLKIILKHQDHPFQIEALLFGQAGLLKRNFKDEYARKLKDEYNFLSQKYSLQPIDERIWKFLRTRPINFHTIRISQLANVISHLKDLLPEIFIKPTVKNISKILNVKTSDYWQTHYVFDKISSKKIKKLGSTAINNLIINAISPFIFFYGKFYSDKKFTENAINLLSSIPPEANKIIKRWREYNIPIKNSADTQALIELYKKYCLAKKCLDCSIGNAIILGSQQ